MIAWPHAQPESLRRRVVTGVAFFAVGSALVLGIRHELGRELRRFREIAQAAQRVLPRPLPARLDGLALAAGSPVSPAAVITTVHSELLRHTRGRIADDVAPLVLRNDPSRVPAQCGDATLRRARREPSNRCSHRQPRDCRAAGAARPAAECRADQQGRRREKGPPHCTRGEPAARPPL